jgi:3-oxoacyl-[acyl-carrier-protein] reductase
MILRLALNCWLYFYKFTKVENMKKVVLVTGASRGIGRCIAENLAIEGYQVIANYYKSKKEAEGLKEKLQKQGIEIDIMQADLSKKEDAIKLVQFVIEKYKKIDVLINNAGIAQTKLFTEITDQDWKNIMNTNLNSVFYMTQQVVKNMLHYHEGCIINISSIWGMTGASCEVAYSVSKAAIDGLTKALAKELAPSQIRVNSVAPRNDSYRYE